jgi:hypothetical protein
VDGGVNQRQKTRSNLKDILKQQMVGRMTQVEHLLNKHKALSSNLSKAKKFRIKTETD